MINELSEKLLRQFEVKLNKVIVESTSPINRLASSLNLVQDTTKSLKEIVGGYSFENHYEEIVFFKKIKPVLYSFKIFEIDLYQLTIKLPIGEKSDVMLYFKDELHEIQRFFSLNIFHYKYYLLGLTNLDNLYFLRDAVIPAGLVHEMQEQDSAFSNINSLST